MHFSVLDARTRKSDTFCVIYIVARNSSRFSRLPESLICTKTDEKPNQTHETRRKQKQKQQQNCVTIFPDISVHKGEKETEINEAIFAGFYCFPVTFLFPAHVPIRSHVVC